MQDGGYILECLEIFLLCSLHMWRSSASGGDEVITSGPDPLSRMWVVTASDNI